MGDRETATWGRRLEEREENRLLSELKREEEEIEIYIERNRNWDRNMKRVIKAEREMGQTRVYSHITGSGGGKGPEGEARDGGKKTWRKQSPELLTVTPSALTFWLWNSPEAPEAEKKFPPPQGGCKNPPHVGRVQGTAAAWVLPATPSIR